MAFYKLILLGSEILFGSAIGALISFLFLSVFFFNYPKLFMKVEKPDSKLSLAEDGGPEPTTNKLIFDRPFEPVSSVTEHTTELLATPTKYGDDRQSRHLVSVVPFVVSCYICGDFLNQLSTFFRTTRQIEMDTYVIKFIDGHDQDTDEHFVTCSECGLPIPLPDNTPSEKFRVLTEHVTVIHHCSGGNFVRD